MLCPEPSETGWTLRIKVHHLYLGSNHLLHRFEGADRGWPDEAFRERQRMEDDRFVTDGVTNLNCPLMVGIVGIQQSDQPTGVGCDHSGQSSSLLYAPLMPGAIPVSLRSPSACPMGSASAGNLPATSASNPSRVTPRRSASAFSRRNTSSGRSTVTVMARSLRSPTVPAPTVPRARCWRPSTDVAHVHTTSTTTNVADRRDRGWVTSRWVRSPSGTDPRRERRCWLRR